MYFLNNYNEFQWFQIFWICKLNFKMKPIKCSLSVRFFGCLNHDDNDDEDDDDDDDDDNDYDDDDDDDGDDDDDDDDDDDNDNEDDGDDDDDDVAIMCSHKMMMMTHSF